MLTIIAAATMNQVSDLNAFIMPRSIVIGVLLSGAKRLAALVCGRDVPNPTSLPENPNFIIACGRGCASLLALISHC